MDAGLTVAAWVHALATVIVLGYYGILGRVVLPALHRSLEGPALGRAVAAVERRALPFVAGSTAAFVASGVYLLVVDPAFAGLGQYTASTWNTLMLVKHALIGPLVVGAFVVHRLAVGLDAADLEDRDRQTDLGYLGLAAEVTTGLGALILLLTAAAQAS